METLLCALRHLVVGDERRVARAVQAAQPSPFERERARFERALAARSGSIVLGRTLRDGGDAGRWVGLDLETALSRSWWWTGSSGGGKTLGCLSFLTQILRRGTNPVIVVDPKGEMAEFLREMILPALAARGHTGGALHDVRFVRPFDRQYVPNLRLTRPEPDVPTEVQALGIATSLAEASGADLGRRMEHVLIRLVTLAIELDEPLTAVARWLDSAQAFGQASRRSRDAALRDYARREYPRENVETIRALRARLAAVLLLPSVREALEARSCLSFEECLARGVTVFDFSDPPGGLDAAVRVVGSIVVGRLARAILNRRLEENSPHVVVAFDEVQELVRQQRSDSVSVGRLLALSRHKRASLHFINQQRAQLGAELSQILRTNTGFECAFRSNLEDAESLGHVLPVPDGTRHVSDARRAVARRMTQLPTRSFLFWVKEQALHAHFVRSPRFDLASLRTLAATLPTEIREQIRKGTAATPRRTATPSVEVTPIEEAASEFDFEPASPTPESPALPRLG